MRARYAVPESVLANCRDFFRDRGREGCEGTGLLAGYRDEAQVHISRFVIPEQRCIKTPFGLSVEITAHAHYTLTDVLSSGERFYARIHSHPGRAYHSKTDDENQILTHQGALSIVVPFFARDPIVLAACAVYRLDHAHGWQQLSVDDVVATFEVTDA